MDNNLTKVTEEIKGNPSLIVSLGIVAGTGATAGLTAYGQHKTDKQLAEIDTKDLTKKDIVKLTWKNYIPAAISLGVTWTLVAVNQHFTNQLAGQVATLTAGIGVIAANKKEIENAIREKYGDEAVDEIKKIARFPKKKEEKTEAEGESTETKPAVKSKQYVKVKAFETGHGNELFIEDYTGMVFRSNRKAVEEGLALFNKHLKEDEYAAYNDLYHALDLHKDPSYIDTKYGWEYGWFIPKDRPEDSNCSNYEEGVQFKMTKPDFSERYGENVTFIDTPFDSPWSNIWDY